MNKSKLTKLSIFFVVIVLIIFIASLVISNKTIVNIKLQSNGRENTLYEIKIKKNGKFELKSTREITESEKTENEYKETLTKLELEKVNTIINKVKDLTGKDKNKVFEFDYKKDININEEVIGIIENMIIALENISQNDITIGDEYTTRRDYGNTMLDNIINTQL